MELNEQNSTIGIGADPTNPLCKELYFLIAKFLSGGPCQRASEALIEELENNEIIPKSVNWLGEPISQDYKTFSSKFDHISPDHLPKLLDQLVKTINAKESSSKVASRSLLSYSTFSLVNKPEVEASKKGSASGLTWSRKFAQNALLRSYKERKSISNAAQAIMERPLQGNGVGDNLLQPEFYSKMGLSCNTLGHLSAVYCVLFDVTGKYIFTGADDHLVKIWSAIDGRLLGTLRGTSSEVSDLAVNYENTMLAVAGCEKMIRIWCLQTFAPITTLNAQGGNITSIFFCPMPRSRSPIRYLASTSTDGSCAFWTYTEEPGEPVQFQEKPTLYLERMRPGNAKMICSSFSSGGIFMAAGSADSHVRVYYMLGSDGPERILEVEHHSDTVDSISWAHEGLRFVSGSKDGTALIWRFENALWRYTRLCCRKAHGEPNVAYEDPKKRPKVTMVGWNTDDSLVLTAVSDCGIRVWNSKTGELIRVLTGHSYEVYVIEAHPTNPRIICTAGHDGRLIIWDIGGTSKSEPGGRIFEYYNQLQEGQGHGALYDCKWSPDGFSLAATDSHAHLMIFTIEGKNNLKFKKLPHELFFHTDYRPITRDGVTNEIVDEQTQVPPHRMPPPFLVDVDGNPYPPNLQRLVPGRENAREEYLVPNVAMSAAGFQEVIEGLPARSNIDEMIHQLAIEQGMQNRNGGRQQSGAEREGRGVGLRRSGEVEGVRQSRGDWQTGNYGFARKRNIIPPLSQGLLQCSETRRLGMAESEESWYQEHLTRLPPASTPGYSQNYDGLAMGTGSPDGRSRRIRRLAAQAAERRQIFTSDQAEFSQLEGVARPNPRPQMEISVNQQSPRRPNRVPSRRVGIATLNNRVANRRPRPVRYDVGRILRSHGASDVENLDLDDSSSEANVDLSSSDSSSSEDSDSDWGGTLGASRRREQENRERNGQGRTRSQRVNSNSSPSEREEERRTSVSEDHEPRPGPSSEIVAPTVTVKSEPHTTKQSRPRKARAKVDYSGGLEEIPEQYRPPEWFAEVCPKRSPYFPQLGDDLVYCRQGHEAYIKVIEEKKIYEIPKKMKKSLPYVLKPELESEVSVRVVGIKFEMEPPRVVVVKLARTDWNTGELIGERNENLYVKYHDVANIVDFLILRQMYDKSIRRRWNEGDRFRCLINRDWWLGTVTKSEPFDTDFPQSNYLSYKVKWDNGDPEQMSPWDMDIIPDDFEIPPGGEDGIPASEEDLRIGLYEPVQSDWPPHGHQDAVCQKLSSLMEQVMELAIAEAFLTPVDLNLYPDYAFNIEYTMDLSTIKARLDNRFYRRVEALKFDVKYIAMNAEKFNELGSDIVKFARVVRDVCLEIISNPTISNVTPVYHRIMKSTEKESTASKLHGKPKSRCSTSTKSSKSGKESKGSSQAQTSSRTMRLRGSRQDDSDSDDRTWQEQCLNLLNEMWHKKDAQPFREPVDVMEYPDYYQVIDTPMDMQAIREDLLGRNYGSVQDFNKDMLLLFSNSKQYNTDKRSAIYSMTVRLQSLYECQIKPILSRSRSKSKKSLKTLSPSKRSRFLPPRGTSSANSTPRKNPKRSAAGRNPYTHKTEESSEEEEEEEENSPGRRLRTSTNIKRRKSISNGHSTSQNRVNGYGTPNMNGRLSGSRNSTGSSGGPPRPRCRPVKRYRISSDESHRSSQASPKRTRMTRNLSEPISPARVANKRIKIPIKNEPESDEFEDSDVNVQMPILDKAGQDHENDVSENDWDDEPSYNASLRRSNRVKRRHDDSDDGYVYETRNRGKQVRSYAEVQEGTDEDEGHQGRRLRPVPRGSPTRSRSNQLGPPVLRRTGRVIESDDEHEEEPGPSSRLMRGQRIRNALEEDEDDNEEAVEEDEGTENDSSEENSDDDDDDDNGQNKRRRVVQPSQRPRRPLRQRQNVSDDDDYEDIAAKKSKVTSSGSRRATRGNTSRPDYAEDSDSEPRITVSSRGRVRRTKSYLGD